MRYQTLSLLIFISTLFAQARAGIEETNWITDVSQITSGGGSNPAALVDGDPTTVWTSDGSSVIFRLPGNGFLDNTPFRVKFTIPAGSDSYPTAFVVYGSHDDNGELKGENQLGYTTKQINYDGSVEYTSPVFYIRGGFNNQWWHCTHLRFECTENPAGNPEQFQLADLRIANYLEYDEGFGPVLKGNGDIINSAEANWGDWEIHYKALIDDNPDTYFDTNRLNPWLPWPSNTTGVTITVPSMEKEENYTLKVGRSKNNPGSFPTKLQLSYKVNGNWTTGETINIPVIESGTEYETQIQIIPNCTNIRFETIENADNVKLSGRDLLNTALSSLQLYGTTKEYRIPDQLPELGTPYPNPNKAELNQDYFKSKLYSQSLVGFDFVHTHGIVDQDFDNNFNADGGWITNKDIWDTDGKLKTGVTVPGASDGVELPDFSYDASVNSSNTVPAGGNGRRQPTTTNIHDVYVIPGERVDLIPYTDISNRSNYFEDFYRYYDYVSDKAHDDVYFLFNPKAGAYNDYGIFGGRALGYVFDDRNYGHFEWNENSPEQRGAGGVASFYRPADDNGLIDEYIAADFSQHYYIDGSLNNASREEDVKRFLDKDNNTIYEPIINFRHIFHVIDGRTLADEMSANREANDKYIKKNRRNISARAGVDFSIRLVNAMPAEEGVNANYYYKKSDGSYTRMGKYDIETYRYNNYKEGELVEGMFEPDEHSAYYTPDYDLETELNPGGENTPAWVAANRKFYRAIKCDAAEAEEGTFLVRFYAKDPNGDRIILEDGKPLILREIVVNFLGKDLASFELEENIPETHSEDYLDKNFKAKSVVDFDKYMALSGTEFVEKDGEGERTRYPAPWMNSSYAFGYKYKQDYSTYMIASHADCVPYKQATQSDVDKHDRLWNNTGGKKQGFFYYANAAGDPGEMAYIKIPSLCVGSTVHISAWVNSMGVYMDNDYDNNEPANVIFNLIAVTKDGREVNISSFSSGYVPNDPQHCGKWMHVYGQITPDLADIDGGNLTHEEVDYYQVALENNSLNSNGADYAIDDIRIYVAQPEVSATQLKPLCNDEKTTTLRVDMPFKKLLDVLGKTPAKSEEEAENIALYYTIYDKDRLKAASADEDGNPKGFSEEIFNGSVLEYKYNDEAAKWGEITFSTHYASLEEWKSNLGANMPSRYTFNEIECISFNITPTDENLEPDKEYIAIFTIPGGDDKPTWADFDVTDVCSKQAEFTVRSSNVIKVDGIVKTGAGDLSVCENQYPVVQVDILGIEAETGEPLIIEECPLIDWYNGTTEEFREAEHEGVLLDEALSNFRFIYPDATTIDQEYTSDANGNTYNDTYRKTIKHFIDNGKLTFASYSYVFDAVRFKDGEKEAYCHATAMPANRQEDRKVGDRIYTICKNPTEITVKVDKRAPGLLDGFDKIEYPETVKDVPVRMGLKQLSTDMYIPLRDIYVVTPGVNQLIEISEDDGIYLVKTNDPALRNLEEEPGGDPNGTGLKQMGKVVKVQASINDKSKGNAKVQFSGKSLFREGYYYTLRLNYREKPENGLLPDDVCDGQTIFTVRIVAEYQMWTGAADGSHNFNNDDNWRRVSADELFSGRADEFTTNGTNSNTFSYSPLDFTKIIIPAGEKYPHMFKPGESGVFEVFDGKEELQIKHPAGLSDDPDAGEATADIEYDLIARNIEGTLYCRPWYANTCEQVHFLSDAEIMNQQHLIYEKAWADMEMEPGRWYTASSPLQSVVAGDMYLPAEGGRQETGLFEPITFNKGVNDRFAPAVYQRGWDKGVANVYELPSGSAAEISNVAVSLDWSNVYNDVQEKYSAGMGYSIKTDISALANKPEEKVSFRLPKDDASFEYWTQDGLDHGPENGGSVPRDSAYRLNPVAHKVTLHNEHSGKYFLAGNPFMAHMRMDKFLEKNSTVINGKYWIMDGDSQQSAVMDETSSGFTGTIETPALVAPMQGFFVEAKAEGTEIVLEFTEEMLATSPNSAGIRMKTRSKDEGGALIITAYSSNDPYLESKASVALKKASVKAYREAEDAVMLADRHDTSTRVYTVAGNNAVSVNSTPDAEGTEIGLLAEEGSLNVLRFDNVGEFTDLCLYDATSGETMPLTEGMEYEVEGPASGRLYLTASIISPAGDREISIEVLGDRVTARLADSCAEIELTVYDVSGKIVAGSRGDKGVATAVGLGKGLYIVTAKSGDTASGPLKIMIR